MKLGFELFDKARFHPQTFVEALEKATFKNSKPIPFTEELKASLIARASDLAKPILRDKMWLIFTDLLFMGINGQLIFWGKNWVTQTFFKEKGFSGEIKYTSKAYRETKAQQFLKNERRNQKMALAVGSFGVASFPLLFLFVLSRKTPVGQGIVGHLKKLIPAFNYHDAIYMSAALMFWQSIFNYIPPGAFAARDQEELREHLARVSAAEFFFFIGDHIFASLAAHAFQYFKRDKLQGIPIIEKRKLGPFHVPLAVSYHKIQDMIDTGVIRSPEAGQLARQLARMNFWLGLVTTSLGMGITFTLFNNWYTERKVRRDQAALALKNQARSLKKGGLPLTPQHTSVPPITLQNRPLHGIRSQTVLWQNMPSPKLTQTPIYPLQSFSLPRNSEQTFFPQRYSRVQNPQAVTQGL